MLGVIFWWRLLDCSVRLVGLCYRNRYRELGEASGRRCRDLWVSSCFQSHSCDVLTRGSQRPSQGIMDLSGVMPLGPACDTAGFFSRDPYKWVKFAKAWYAPNLHQDVSVTGLSPLHVPDTEAWPKTILCTSYHFSLFFVAQ